MKNIKIIKAMALGSIIGNTWDIFDEDVRIGRCSYNGNDLFVKWFTDKTISFKKLEKLINELYPDN